MRSPTEFGKKGSHMINGFHIAGIFFAIFAITFIVEENLGALRVTRTKGVK